MKREQTIRVGILSAVFVLALIVFSLITNHGNTDMTADMGMATLPMISFQSAGKEVNLLAGHQTEMDMVAMRDTIAVYEKGKELTVHIKAFDNHIRSAEFEIYSMDGQEKLQDGRIGKVGEKVSLKVKENLQKNQEGILKLILKLDQEEIYYYTRIVLDNGYRTKDCIAYAEEMHANFLKKENESAVKKVLETNVQGEHNSLQHVTIQSDVRHVMWGDLKPKVVENPHLEIKETNKAYTSILMKYQVECAGDNNKKEIYDVQEFFKVSYGTNQVFLLEYDRVMEEVFTTSNVVLSGKGIILGIADSQLPHRINAKGTIVAFIQNRELWSYNKEDDAFSLVFSFANAEKKDVRHFTNQHSIQLLSMEENGNLTFSVCGYMNRGIHEGESGMAIYFYNMEHNSVEEVAFVPSNTSQLVIEEELNELAYYNEKEETLYMLVGGKLLKVQDRKQSVLMEQLVSGQYVASKDGRLLAYQAERDGIVVTEIRDFSNNRTRTVQAAEGERILPLGFVGEDFVYGISKEEYAGVDVVGTAVQAMQRLEIRNKKNEVIKTYEKQDVYILGVNISGNMITVRQGTKDGNRYAEIASDYITNSETAGNEHVSLQSYWTDLKETQYRISFSEGIKNKQAKVMKPKQVIQEKPLSLEIETQEIDYYYVYGHGKQAGIYAEAGAAVAHANRLAGVVISPKQNYVWEADNRVSWYRNFEVDRHIKRDGASTVASALKTVLSYEGEKAEAVAELGTKTVTEILEEALQTEAVQFRGCAVENIRYLIDKGVPVIGLRDASNAILLIGYDARTITYVDFASGAVLSGSFDKLNTLLAGSGQTLIGYVR